MADFDCDSYLRIEDTLAFGQAVARRIAGYVGGAEGLCLYQRTRSIEGDLGYVDVMRAASDGTTTYDQQKLMDAVAALAGHAPLFLKEGTFAHQAEYRLFWFTDGPVPPYLDVKVPEARQFCSEPNERTE
jgi:hypothetical protein